MPFGDQLRRFSKYASLIRFVNIGICIAALIMAKYKDDLMFLPMIGLIVSTILTILHIRMGSFPLLNRLW